MLAIRLQRKGRKGHAQFRVIVQDSRLSPKSEKVVAYLGAYNPHDKTTTLDKEKAEFYLSNGAQPSQRVAKLLKDNKVKLPDWVELRSDFEGKLKNPEKLRKNQPKEEEQPEEAAPEAAEEKPAEAPATEEAKEDSKEESAEESEDK